MIDVQATNFHPQHYQAYWTGYQTIPKEACPILNVRSPFQVWDTG